MSAHKLTFSSGCLIWSIAPPATAEFVQAKTLVQTVMGISEVHDKDCTGKAMATLFTDFIYLQTLLCTTVN